MMDPYKDRGQEAARGGGCQTNCQATQVTQVATARNPEGANHLDVNWGKT